MMGELFRGFLKHKVYGTVYVVERDDSGAVLAALEMHEATACRHRLDLYTLELTDAERINKTIRDFESFEPVCGDAGHLLADIGAASRECLQAENSWQVARSRAKALKETFEEKNATLRKLVRDSTAPPKLPLFDQEPPAPPVA